MNAYKNILLPMDFSEPCTYAAERIKELTDNYNAELTILHVIDYLPPSYVTVVMPAELSSKEFLLKKATTHMNEWTAEHGLSESKVIIETGSPKKVITTAIKDLGCDLVVLAPQDENAFFNFFGSVTNAVAQDADCDVLILRRK